MSLETKQDEQCQDADVFEVVLPITICLLSDDDLFLTDEDNGVHEHANSFEDGELSHTCVLDTATADHTPEKSTSSQSIPYTLESSMEQTLESPENSEITEKFLGAPPFPSGNEEADLYGTTSGKVASSESQKLQWKTDERNASENDVCQLRRSKRLDCRIRYKVNSKDTKGLTFANKSDCKLRGGQVSERDCDPRFCSRVEDNTREENPDFQCSSSLSSTEPSLTTDNLIENTKSDLVLHFPATPTPSSRRSKKVARNRLDVTCSTRKQPMRACKVKMETVKLCFEESFPQKSKRCKYKEGSVMFENINLQDSEPKHSHKNIIQRCECHKRYDYLQFPDVYPEIRRRSLRNAWQLDKLALQTNHVKKRRDLTPFTHNEAEESLKSTIVSLSCKACQFSCRDIKDFLVHIKDLCIGKPYQCPNCNYSTSHFYKLEQHVYRHVGENLFKCQHCPYPSNAQENFRRHSVVHSDAQILLYESAFKCLFDVKPLIVHDVNLKTSHACDQCNCRFNNELLSYHKLAHSISEQATSPSESLNIKNKAILQPCNLSSTCKCEYTTDRSADLNNHFQMNSGETPVKCDPCEKTFCTSRNLVEHSSSHLQFQLYKCKTCTYYGKTRKALEVHRCKHQGNASCVQRANPSAALRHDECEASLSSSQHCGVNASNCIEAEINSSSPLMGMPPQRRHSFVNHQDTSTKLCHSQQCESTTCNSSNFTLHVQRRTADKSPMCKQQGAVACLEIADSSEAVNQNEHDKLQRDTSSLLVVPPLVAYSENKYETSLLTSQDCGEHLDNDTESTLAPEGMLLERHNHSHNHSETSRKRLFQQCDYATYNSSNLKWNVQIHTSINMSMCNQKCNVACVEAANSFETMKHDEYKHQRIYLHIPVASQLVVCGQDEHEASLPIFQAHAEQIHNDTEADTEISLPTKEMHLERSNPSQNHRALSRKLHKCQQCEYGSSNTSNFKQHVRIHTGEKPFKCNFCKKVFRVASHLNRHMAVHWQQEFCFSENCSCSGESMQAVVGHRRNFQNVSSGKVIVDPMRTSRHAKYEDHFPNSQHLGEIVDHCGVKNKDSHPSARVTLNTSSQNRTENSVKLYKCQQCEYMSCNSSNFKQHVRIHTGEKPYKCNQCEKAFRVASHFKRHMFVHRNQELHKSDKCFYTDASADDLRVHRKSCKRVAANGAQSCSPLSNPQHPGVSSSNDLSKDEGNHMQNKSSIPSGGASSEVFNTMQTYSDFNVHVKTHPGVQMCKGEQCSKTFRRLGHVIRPKQVHIKDPTVHCDSSDYATFCSKSLQMHKAVHAETRKIAMSEWPRKPYKCDKCKYITVNSWNLKLHLRTHTGEKPHKCDHCSLTFRTSSHLTRHQLIHTRLKLYRCKYATKSCSTYKKHVTNHRNEPSSTTEECNLTLSGLKSERPHKKK
ncbi:zinc finger protein 721-like [Ambystoma mexicanum]|uniref:zinc finger protein 721-like n=1 Tax=Ambystoma mexicanum TaxID=8296 RepID=UPI0037E8F6F7